jgi:hypothetical protein
MALRSPPPAGSGIGSGVGGMKGFCSCHAGARLPAGPGRVEWAPLHTSYCQSATLPFASSLALTVDTIAQP